MISAFGAKGPGFEKGIFKIDFDQQELQKIEAFLTPQGQIDLTITCQYLLLYFHLPFFKITLSMGMSCNTV